MRDYLAIVKRNILSPIVIGIFLLAGALIYVGEHRDAWFISIVIIINSCIGIIQEIRAKRALKKLELMSAPRAKVVRGSETVEIAYEDLRIGDEMVLHAGDEVPADATVTTSRGLEVNESMLTGESIAVAKAAKQPVYAATSVVAGSARAVVTAIGEDTKAGTISKVLKRYKPELTPLQKQIQRAISWLTFGAIGLAVLIFVVYFFSGEEPVQILKTITVAAVTVVPEGLLLASSLLLAFGSLKLAQAKVLPQKLSAIEAMALLNVLCVDKTGTLTSDEITLSKIVPFGDTTKTELSKLAAIVAKEASGGNATGEAVVQGTKLPGNYEVQEVLAFSSARKISAARFQLDGKKQTALLGAPEFVSKIIPVDAAILDQVEAWTNKGQRVLLLARITDHTTSLKTMKQAKGNIAGAIVLDNPLRDGVKDTVEFLQRQGVSMRVISGDNPGTVRYVASEVGIKRPSLSITGPELAQLDNAAFKAAADKYTIFARVLPEQKEKLIRHFKKQRLFTGMVGDGVNDALALKKADLGVAMYAGAAASRRVADIILLNNSFTSLPLGMKLGNRIMQAIEVIASLFFHKIIYGVVLLFSTMLLGMTYPYAPRHITFMNMFLVTMPTLMWTLFPPLPRHRVNPKRFWRDTLGSIAPIAVITGLAVTFTYWIMSLVYADRPMAVATMTVLTATFFGVYMVFLVPNMLGVTVNRRAKYARRLYLIAVALVASTSFSIGFLRDFFDFSAPTIWILWPAITVISLAAAVQWQIAKTAAKRYLEK